MFRVKVPIPATDKFVTTKNRPVGTSEDHFVEWSTLTHADLEYIPTSVSIERMQARFHSRGALAKGDFSKRVTLASLQLLCGDEIVPKEKEVGHSY